jgi:hypothetical protein
MSAHIDIAIAAEEGRQRKRQIRVRRPRGDTRFPAIGRHARILCVNRATLYRMLIGAVGWELPALRSRYNALIQSEGRSV